MSVDLSGFPEALATQLGIDTFAGNLIASGILIALFLFPTLFLSKKLHLTDAVPVAMTLITLSIVVALGWFPVWVFIIIVLILSVIYARSFMGLGSG